MILFIKEWLLSNSVPELWALILKALILVFAVVIVSYIANFIAKRIIVRIVARLVKRSKNRYDDIIYEKGVFNRLSHIVPAVIIYYSASHALADFPVLIKPVISASYIYIVAITLAVANAFINAMHDIYQHLPVSKSRPIKGYVQIVKIIIFFIGGIIILSVILGESPYALLAGLGAMTAVLLFVFRDTILGLVASIQLSANKMLKPGDYIIIAKDNIEGTVKEINLTSVKIHNPDNTINYIPTYSLISQPFSNWIGVEQAKSRRIKRSINIDVRSIRFTSDNLLKKLKENELLKDFIKSYYDSQLPAPDSALNTNLGLFRKYAEFYLRLHPAINPVQPFVIRQLQPTNAGLPLEIYVFINELDWARFEEIQSGIFEHLIAILREFEISILQNEK